MHLQSSVHKEQRMQKKDRKKTWQNVNSLWVEGLMVIFLLLCNFLYLANRPQWHILFSWVKGKKQNLSDNEIAEQGLPGTGRCKQ